MPLHLLGKKSWNVYNPESIARVRRDEAAAKAREQEEELQLHEVAADHQLRILRGEQVDEVIQDVRPHEVKISRDPGHERKHRRRKGENDTDRDLRLAQDGAMKHSEQPLFDSKGHIDLVPKHAQRLASKMNEKQDTTGFRFNGAVSNTQANSPPWYSMSTSHNAVDSSTAGRDVWGNEDPRRRERDQMRMSSSDPLMAMKKGIKTLRENEIQKQQWREHRERDLNEVEEMARKHHRHRRKHRHRREAREESLDGFSLDAESKHAGDEAQTDRHRHRDRSRSHRRRERRSQSPRRVSG